MGEHTTPWLDRWREQEPLRFYLWGVSAAVLLGGVAVGLWSETWALAVGGVAAAALMLGGTALARRDVFTQNTVDRLLDSQHADSYQKGYAAALRTVEQAAAQRPELEPATRDLRALPVPTEPRGRLGRCRYVESGRRCTLPFHPETISHRLEGGRAAE